MTDDPLWLVSWILTVALCVWKLAEGIWDSRRMLEWPFLAAAMWLYFYGYMACQAKLTLSAYLGNGMAGIGQLMPLLSFVGLIAGWEAGKRAPFRRSVEEPVYPYAWLWLISFCLIAVGALGAYSVVHAMEEEGARSVQTASAYWYLLFYVGYPGMAIAIWALLKMKSSARFVLWGLTTVTIVAFMLPHVINVRRGPLFPAVIVLLLVWPLTVRRPPNRLFYVGGLVAAAVAMLLFLQIRAVTYKGGSWGEALQTLNVNAAVDRGEEADDNEYVNNCQLIGTIFQNGKYQYGTGHLELLVHWVPRSLWWAKPGLGEGNYSFNEMFDDVERATGVRLLGAGAAAGGVADSFVQYGVLCPLYWFALSAGVGVIYAKVLRSRRPQWIFAYVGFICASHWLVSQSLPAAFVPAMYFESVPLLVFFGLWVYRRWMPAPRRPVQSRPRPKPLAQPAPLS